MAISNLHETLLMYTKQKSMINRQLNDIMSRMFSATRQTADNQARYNSKQQDAYYKYYVQADSPDQYQMVMAEVEMDHELELQKLNSWEMQMELQKNNLESRLNEITTSEASFTKLLQNNIKNDFSYGGGSGQ